MEYLRSELTFEEFFQKIDTSHESENYEAGKVRLTKTEETLWQSLVAQSWAFNPESFFPERE